MHSLDLLLLKDITRKKRRYQKYDKNKERPRREELLLVRVGGLCNLVSDSAEVWDWEGAAQVRYLLDRNHHLCIFLYRC